MKTRAATATDCSQPTELPLPPAGEGGDGVSPQAADAKADNTTAPAAAEGKADAEKATPAELPLPPVGEGGDGVSAQAADAKADSATAPAAAEGKADTEKTATTELPLPPVGEGGDGVSPQAADAKADNATADDNQAILDAKQAAENPIDYTAAPAPDLYADRDGKPSEQPVPGGFVRKTLGKTADGRLVVQDYYQDSGTPQTAPLTLKKGADPRDFTTAAVDGKAVWYSVEGDIFAIQQYQNGESTSPLRYYREGRLSEQSEPSNPQQP